MLSRGQKVITVYDETGRAPAQTIAADGSITYFNEGYADRVEDVSGNVLVKYTYDENRLLIKTEFIEARKQLEQAYQQAVQEIETNKDKALADLEVSELKAREEIAFNVANSQAQIDSERARLEKERSKYDPGIYDLSEFDRVFRELEEYQTNQYIQEAEANLDLGEKEIAARENIESDVEQAMQDLIDNDYNVILGDLAQKESSPIVYAYYRAVLGRDPDQSELEYWLNKAKTDYTPTDSIEIDQYIREMEEFTQRQTWKQNIISEVSFFFEEYIGADASAKETMLSSLGLTLEDVGETDLTQEDLTDILTWLEDQSLHFGDSAFKTITQLFNNKGITETFESIGVSCIKIDILSGVITKDTAGDLVISMYAMRKTTENKGLILHAERIDFDEVKSQLSSGADVILHVNDNHYVVLKEINEVDGTVAYKDLSVGADGQDITLSRAEFMEEWKGYVLSESPIISTENEKCKYLNIAQEKNIRGSGWWDKFWKGVVNFFSKVAAPVAAVLMFIPGAQPLALALLGVNAVIQTVSFVARTGTLLDAAFAVGGFLLAGIASASEKVGGIFYNIKTFLGNVGDAIMVPIKGIVKHALPIFESVADVVRDVVGGIGSVVNGVLGETLGTAVVEHGVRTAVEIGASQAFSSMGLDSSLVNIGSALVGGFTTGAIDPDINVLTSTLMSGTVAGVEEIGAAMELDTRATQLAAITAGALVGGMMEIDGITYTSEQLATDITQNIASELAYMGVQELGETLGVDPTISYLAGIGIRSSLTTSLDGGNWWDGAISGLAQGATSVSLQWAADELELDPLVGALASNAIAGAIEGILEDGNPIRGVFDSAYKAGTGFLTMGGSGATPWEQAAYAAQISDFTKIVREQGIEVAIETYATGFFHQETINSIWKLGGIYDLIANADQVEITENDKGEQVKRIYLSEITSEGDKATANFIDLSINDDRLMGRREGNVTEHCFYEKQPDGTELLTHGEREYDLGNGMKRIQFIENYQVTREVYADSSGSIMVDLLPADGEKYIKYNYKNEPIKFKSSGIEEKYDITFSINKELLVVDRNTNEILLSFREEGGMIQSYISSDALGEFLADVTDKVAQENPFYALYSTIASGYNALADEYNAKRNFEFETADLNHIQECNELDSFRDNDEYIVTNARLNGEITDEEYYSALEQIEASYKSAIFEAENIHKSLIENIRKCYPFDLSEIPTIGGNDE